MRFADNPLDNPLDAEISESEGAKKGPFCMGILATLGLSTEFAPRAEKNIFVGKVASEHP